MQNILTWPKLAVEILSGLTYPTVDYVCSYSLYILINMICALLTWPTRFPHSNPQHTTYTLKSMRLCTSRMALFKGTTSVIIYVLNATHIQDLAKISVRRNAKGSGRQGCNMKPQI